MTEPKRIQLKRVRGWRMPANTVKVDRTTKFGNPFIGPDAALLFDLWINNDLKELERFVGSDAIEGWAIERAKYAEHVMELEGKNLACWCKPDRHCHADSLLSYIKRSALADRVEAR